VRTPLKVSRSKAGAARREPVVALGAGVGVPGALVNSWRGSAAAWWQSPGWGSVNESTMPSQPVHARIFKRSGHRDEAAMKYRTASRMVEIPEGALGLGEDLGGPQWSIESCFREAQEQIGQGLGHQDVCAEQRRIPHARSAADSLARRRCRCDAEFVGLPTQLSEHLSSVVSSTVLVIQDIGGADASVSSGLVVGDLFARQDGDQGRAADFEHLGSFLGAEYLVVGGDGDGAPVDHGPRAIAEHGIDFGRQQGHAARRARPEPRSAVAAVVEWAQQSLDLSRILWLAGWSSAQRKVWSCTHPHQETKRARDAEVRRITCTWRPRGCVAVPFLSSGIAWRLRSFARARTLRAITRAARAPFSGGPIQPPTSTATPPSQIFFK